MSYSFSKHDTIVESNTTIGKLGILIGLTFKNAPDKFLTSNNTRDEFFDSYERIQSVGNNYASRAFCMEELYNLVKSKADSFMAYEMKILATLPEAEVLLNTDLKESIGVALFLYEGEPEKTTVIISDYSKWSSLILMMQNSSPN